jgi:hypothetical protein
VPAFLLIINGLMDRKRRMRWFSSQFHTSLLWCSIVFLVIASMTSYHAVGKAGNTSLGAWDDMIYRDLRDCEFLLAVLTDAFITLDQRFAREVRVEKVSFDVVCEAKNGGIFDGARSPGNDLIIPGRNNLNFVFTSVFIDAKK